MNILSFWEYCDRKQIDVEFHIETSVFGSPEPTKAFYVNCLVLISIKLDVEAVTEAAISIEIKVAN